MDTFKRTNRNVDIILKNNKLIIKKIIQKKLCYYSHLSPEDLVEIEQDGLVAARKAAESFDESKGYKFGTYINKPVLWAVNKALKKIQKEKKWCHISIDRIEDQNLEMPDEMRLDQTDYLESRHQINRILTTLKETEAELLTMKYGLNNSVEHSEAEIARMRGISRAAVNKQIHRIFQKIRNNMNN